MSLELLGRKLGMTHVFDDVGDRITVTVIEAGPCVVVQKKTPQTDGYAALQLGFEERKEKHTSKAAKGHFDKAEQSPKRFLYEVRVKPEELEGFEVGQQISVADAFNEVPKVDVMGTSKGKGFAGVIKRHHYGRSKMTHGTHEFFRHGGAMAAGTYPGRIHKGKKMAGHMGAEQVTTLGLRLARLDAEKNLLFVRGSVPGHAQGLVRVRVSSH